MSSPRALGFRLSEGLEVPAEPDSRFKFVRQKSKLARTIRSSYFAIKKSTDSRPEHYRPESADLDALPGCPHFADIGDSASSALGCGARGPEVSRIAHREPACTRARRNGRTPNRARIQGVAPRFRARPPEEPQGSEHYHLKSPKVQGTTT